MARLITGPELLDAAREAYTEHRTARLAIAFWGRGAAEAFGFDRAEDLEIVCNLEMGGTNPNEVQRLIDLGARVYAHPTLHAKFGVVGRTLAFVGSSNASANGLGLQGGELRGWEELNVAFTGDGKRDALLKRFEELKETAIDLTAEPERLDAARVVWLRRRAVLADVRDPAAAHGSLWETMLADPSWFADRQCFVVAYQKMVDPEEIENFEAGAEEVQDRLGSEFDCYWDWKDLPGVGSLIDFQITPRGRWAFRGYRRRSPDYPDQEINDETFYPVMPSDTLLGRFSGMVGDELNAFRQCLLHYRREHVPDSDDSFIIPLEAFALYAAENCRQL